MPLSELTGKFETPLEQTCSLGTVVTCSIRFMRIFLRFRGEGRETTVGRSETAIFSNVN